MNKLGVELRRELKRLIEDNAALRSQIPGKGPLCRASDGACFDSDSECRRHEMLCRYTAIDKKGETIVLGPGELNGNPYVMERLSQCRVVLADYGEQVTCDYLTNCKVFIGASAGSVFIRDCKNCTFTICAERVLVRDCTSCTLNLKVRRQTQLETCEQIGLAPFNGMYKGMADHHLQAGYVGNLKLEKADMWSKVIDDDLNGVKLVEKNEADENGNWEKRKAKHYEIPNRLCDKQWLVETDYGDLKTGDIVSCRHGGQSQFFPARVKAQLADGTYAIVYDDGDEETGVLRFRIKSEGERQSKGLKPGQVVDAAFSAEDQTLFRGKVLRGNDDGTYNIEFDDGDRAWKVSRGSIFAACGKVAPTASA
jgi:hypothetical protein